jgi:sulfate transport system substrate-binding protein
VIAKQLNSDFPQIKTLLKVEDLGDWNSIGQKFFSEGAIFDKIQAQKALS